MAEDPLDAAVLAAARAAPRRWHMPPLPAGASDAAAADADTALAFAIEAVRPGAERGEGAPEGLRDLFVSKLAEWIAAALEPGAGDPAFKALLLRVHDDDVREHYRLSVQANADRRMVRSAVDAVAHPGKLRGMAAGPLRDALAALHDHADQGEWSRVRSDAAALHLDDLAALPSLERLERGESLARLPSVARYVALCSARGPLAGSNEASRQGRASARVGDFAEHETLKVLREIAAALPGLRTVRSLRTPRAFPGEPGKAKDEWDVALLHDGAPGARLVLLAEVKASPAAAVPDFSRLHRGLVRLASANAGESYTFASSDGPVTLTGASLRELAPAGRALPAHVIYCSTAPANAQPPVLAAAAKAVLLAEPASLAFAQRVVHGDRPPSNELAPVWDALATEPRLRAVLHQYHTGRIALDAMLHPDDLLAAFNARGRGA